jgi:stage V sporulation protein R
MITRTKPISGDLLELRDEIHQYAIDYGLDFYPVVFEVCDYDTISILAAQGGFPSRYPHWRFGMEYDQLSKSYTYGLQKIYEMVINTSPCYAYLLKSNQMIDQKLVMSHVYGHADFFKNNAWFASTDKNMMDVMANHGTKVRRYMETFGQDTVEDFIDRVLSLENLLDVQVLFDNKDSYGSMPKKAPQIEDEVDVEEFRSTHLNSFMRSKLLNPDEPVEEGPVVEGSDAKRARENTSHIRPRDVMLYLIENAPLEDWQADILAILREEAYYFLPQRMTKIMNEGWASYWHSTIMTKKALNASEIIDFADKHAGVMAMSRLIRLVSSLCVTLSIVGILVALAKNIMNAQTWKSERIGLKIRARVERRFLKFVVRITT